MSATWINSSKPLSILCALFSILTSCQQSTPAITHITPSFYHWQTAFEISELEQTYLDSLSAKKIYLKFFDVDWDFTTKQPTPHALLQVKTTLAPSITIIPTVFITNRTLEQIEASNLETLSQQIANKLIQQFAAFSAHRIQTIQFDCDWTLSTKDTYFRLLELLQVQLSTYAPIDLSATIRLHQVKYLDKTGIPPVKRGTLMFYNMGEVLNKNTKNSILDLSIAQQYTSYLEAYPLPLDLALPLFQWGVLFRKGKMIQLINQLHVEELSDSTRFFQESPNQWIVLKNTYLNGLYLYKGDFIRLEKVAIEDLEASVTLLQPYFEGKDFDLIFYHLEEEVLQNYSVGELKKRVDFLLNKHL